MLTPQYCSQGGGSKIIVFLLLKINIANVRYPKYSGRWPLD